MTVHLSTGKSDINTKMKEILKAFENRLELSKGVFLKPNIVFPVREKKGEITKLKVIKALITELREIDPKVEIIIGEGTAAGTLPSENFKISGYSKLVKELKVQLLDLNQVEHIKLNWKYGSIQLPKLAFEKTYINLPILKISSAATISGAMKNQKGLLLPNMKKKFHKLDLHAPIAHLNKLVQPDLTIMDGINFFGKNIIISGDNTYEIDSFSIKILKFPKPDYLIIARQIGVGNDDFKIFGGDIKSIKIRHKYTYKEYRKLFKVRIWSNPRACSMCRYVFSRIKRSPMEDIKYTILMYLKILKYAFTGAEIVIGSEPKFEARNKNVICIGNCTKKIAKEKGYKHIPGCPPTKGDMLKYF